LELFSSSLARRGYGVLDSIVHSLLRETAREVGKEVVKGRWAVQRDDEAYGRGRERDRAMCFWQFSLKKLPIQHFKSVGLEWVEADLKFPQGGEL